MPPTTLRRRWLVPICLCVVAAWIAGCQSVTEAIVDGFFSGISDTIAAIVSEALTSASE